MDFVVQLKIKNGRLLRAIRKHSVSVADFSRKSGVSQTAIGGLLSMRLSPLRKDGEWTTSAKKIALCLGVEPEVIWPAHMEKILLKKGESEIDLSLAEVVSIGNGESSVIQKQLLAKMARTLTPRQIEVIGRRNRGETLGEIAADFGVTISRIRQIEIKGMRKMKDSARFMGIKSYQDCN